MNEHDLKHIIEATLLAAGRPVTTQQLLDLFDERERPTLEHAQAALALLTADYAPRGVELVEVASGWRIQVRSRVAEFVSRLWQERPSRYSRALLETLALVAYRQPITRSEIEEIRGVSISSTIMRTLQERNWIRIVGHREVPGRPELLGTTREFLDYFGLRSLDQLPTLAELKDVETMGVQLELSAGEGSSDPAEAEPAGAADDVLVAAADGDVGANAEVEVDTDADAEEDDDDSSEEGADEALDAQRASDDPSLSADDAGVESEARAPLVASDELYDEQRSLVEPPPDSQT